MKNKFISPLTWVGGKSKQWNLIKSYFPKDTKNLTYVEPFFGGGSVGLNALREQLFTKYIFNDLDKELMMMWKNMSEKIQYPNLINENMFFPNMDLEKITSFFEASYSYGSPLEYIMRNNLTFNGLLWGTFTQKRLEQNWNLNKFKRIMVCAELLKSNKNIVEMYNKDYKQLGSSLTITYKYFFYLDPPYFGNKGKPYRHRFKDDDWKEFLEFLKTIDKQNCKFLLSIDDCFETREMFKDFNIHTADWAYTSSNVHGNGKCKIGKELFVKNYN